MCFPPCDGRDFMARSLKISLNDSTVPYIKLDQFNGLHRLFQAGRVQLISMNSRGGFIHSPYLSTDLTCTMNTDHFNAYTHLNSNSIESTQAYLDVDQTICLARTASKTRDECLHCARLFSETSTPWRVASSLSLTPHHLTFVLILHRTWRP
jgi:hypothetical protein